MLFKKILRKIFSVYNFKYFKVVCLLGYKLKIFNHQRYLKYRDEILAKYVKKHRLNAKRAETLYNRIVNLEKVGFIIEDYKKDIILANKRLRIKTDSYAWIAEEIFYDELYKIPAKIINKKKKYNVLDIGANRCYTALYFADKKWVKNIYSFELVPKTYQFALENIKLNHKYVQNKIYLYNLGLGSENKEIQTSYLSNRDGISTYNIEWLNQYAPKAISKAEMIDCKIKKASEVLKQIIEEQKIANIIFKIDVEGAEYDILQDLANNYPEIFEKIEILIGDTHCGFEQFLKIIAPFNFKIVEAEPKSNGTCSFTMIKGLN